VRSDGAVHPDWRRRGLGTALTPWLIGRAGELHVSRHPDVPGEVSNSAISTNVGADRLLHRFGFEPCRYFFGMKRSLLDAVPEAPRADGLQVVPFDASMDERLRVTHNDVFTDHWGSVDEATWMAWFTGASAFQAGSSFLVLDGDCIAAYVLGYDWEARHPCHRDPGAVQRPRGHPAVILRTRAGADGVDPGSSGRICTCRARTTKPFGSGTRPPANRSANR
jgi:hypothetical protein